MKLASASTWVLVGFFFNVLARFASNLVMARLLSPEAFGIVAIANVLLLGFQLISDIGLKQSIIRYDDKLTREYLDTVWSIQVIKGVVISVLVSVAAAFLYFFGNSFSGVYSNQTLPSIILVIALTPLFQGFESTKIALSNRNLLLGLITRIEIYSQFLGVLIGVKCAIEGWGVWSLVVGPLAATILRIFLGTFMLPGALNKFCINRVYAAELLNFGKWMLVSSLIAFLAYNGDQLILGAVADVEYMGYFAISVFMLGVFRTLVTKLSTDVFFAKLSLVYRDNPLNLKAEYYRFRHVVDAYTCIVAGGIYVVADTLVGFLYDGRYSEVASIMQVLSVGLIFERYAMVGPLFWVSSNAKVPAITQFVKIATLFVFLGVALFLYEIEVAIWAIPLAKFAEVPIVFYFKIKFGYLNLLREIFTLIYYPVGLFLGFVFNYIFDIGFI